MNFTELRRRILAVVPQGISVHFKVTVTDSEWRRAGQQPPDVSYRCAFLYIKDEQLAVTASTPGDLWEAFQERIIPKLESSIPTDELITALDSINEMV